VTAVVEETETAPAIQNAAETRCAAPWHLRASALVVDLVPGLAAVTTMAVVCLTVPAFGVWWWLCGVIAGLVILLLLVNRLLLPAVTGWSLGRANVNIAVVRRDGTAIGPWRLLVRELAHLLDTASLFLGWLWPLWDQRRRTFADLLVGTEVRVVEPSAPLGRVRRLTVIAALTATSLCLIGAVTSFAGVYWHERTVKQASDQVTAQGPKMVVEMLSYDPKTMRDDFARAQSLTTDRYRGQLVKQQQAVQKHPVLNQYFVTNAAVLQPVAPTHASMMLFMRGQRGPASGQRLITATVRVSFVKGANGQWRVDDLNVLTKPRPAAGGGK
jgi:Mce-associated membrane protein